MNIDNLQLVLDDDPIEEVVETTEEQDIDDSSETEETDDSEESEEQEEEVVEDKPDELAKLTFDRLVAQGLLEADESFTGTFEDIEERLEDVPSKLLKQAVTELPEKSQAMLNFIVAAGANITPEEIFEFAKTYLGEQAVVLETEDEAKEYLENKYKAAGWKNGAIKAQIEELEDDGELLDEAKKQLAEDNKKSQKLIESKESQNKQAQDSQRQFYSAISEELKTLNYTKKKVEQIQSTMPKSNQILGEVIKSPKAYVQLIDFLSKFKNNEFDLSDYLKQGASKATSNMKEILEKNAISSGSKSTGTVSKYVKDDRYIPTID